MNSDDTVRHPEGDPNAFWEEFDWNELNAAEQRLWGTLGWSQASWDGDSAEPPSESKSFNELAEGERNAAEQLGYTEASWDED